MLMVAQKGFTPERVRGEELEAQAEARRIPVVEWDGEMDVVVVHGEQRHVVSCMAEVPPIPHNVISEPEA